MQDAYTDWLARIADIRHAVEQYYLTRSGKLKVIIIIILLLVLLVLLLPLLLSLLLCVSLIATSWHRSRRRFTVNVKYNGC